MDPDHACRARRELQRLLGSENSGTPGAAPGPFPLDRAAFLIAADEYPFLDPSLYETQLDALAARTAEATDGRADDDPRVRLGALRRVLFEEEAFHGDRESYYDVRNSYLNEVMDRKLGIPISLAALMIGVARRVGWRLVPVNFPCHFLLADAWGEELLAVDPFHGGLILGPDDLEERWRAATGAPAPPVSQMLVPADPKSVVIRMLNNIWMVHANAHRYALAVLAKEKIALIDPGEPSHDRELGYLCAGAGDASRAAGLLSRYLERLPYASDRRTVREHLARLGAGQNEAPRHPG